MGRHRPPPAETAGPTRGGEEAPVDLEQAQARPPSGRARPRVDARRAPEGNGGNPKNITSRGGEDSGGRRLARTGTGRGGGEPAGRVSTVPGRVHEQHARHVALILSPEIVLDPLCVHDVYRYTDIEPPYEQFPWSI